ncbi:MAG: M64 family metallopeptidase [Rhodothermales bacterium]|nr:M64 family metallopeptidase [Rhodothermales bacterium]
MPITDIQWGSGADVDVHVVVGQASANLLSSRLFVREGANFVLASTYLAAHNDTTITFRPLFKGIQTGDVIAGLGISFNTTNGVCSLSNTLPTPRKDNFVVEVEARNAPAGDLIASRIIRYHVHQSIEKLWLTPGELTVRPLGVALPALTPYRFSVRAQFDDGMVGEMTLFPGLAWTPPGHVDGNGRLSIDAGEVPGDTETITVTLPAAVQADPAARSASATMRVGQDWSPANPIDVSIVVGGGWPGTINPEVVPNVLFIGDGFGNTPADKTRFEGYVDSLVHFLKMNPLNHPYDVLATSMNFWSAFIPSPSIGVSIRSEVFSVGAFSGFMLPPEPVPAGHVGLWSLPQLLYMVGLPVRAHDLAQAALTNAAIQVQWQTNTTVDPAPFVDDDLINRWRMLAQRTLVNDVDSPLGVRVGKPVSNGTFNQIGLNSSDRVTRDGLDHLLRSLRDPRLVPVADLWAKRTDGTLPNNYDLVCIVVPSPGRAVNETGNFFVQIIDTLKVKAVAGLNAVELDFNTADVPATSDNERGRLLAHELTHSFGVGDEYGEHTGPPIDPASLNVDAEYGNLALEADTKNGAGDFDGGQIKWNWHRIRKAGVLDLPIQDTGGGVFLLPLRQGDGYPFEKGDIVHLRFRVFPKPLGKFPKLSAPLEIVDPAPTDSSIHVQLKAGALFNYPNIIQPAQFIAEFPAGSVVYIPTPAPESVRSDVYPYAEMVAKNIKDYITTQKKPLTVLPAVVDDNAVQAPVFTAAVNLPDCFSKNRPRIIGLYSGGATYHIGLYHPAGTCMMRDDHTDGREFCAVCRYILVDIIDPARHFEIDRNYQTFYPQA